MATRAITALFDDYDDAAKAVDRIEAEGIPHADIAIVANNREERHSGRVGDAPAAADPGTVMATQGDAEDDAADGAGAGATVGTVLGGGAGLLAGLGLIAIPGVGPVVAAGWLVAALTGAGIGAATGGLLGALTGAGLSDADAETYAEGVRRGGTLVTVRADDARTERVMHLLKRSGSIDLDERAQGWRSQGWTGGTIGTADGRLSDPTEDAAAVAPGPVQPVRQGVGSKAGGFTMESEDGLLSTGEPRSSADPKTAPATKPPPGGIR